ncbi:MAG: hypothetical protein JWL60_995 [Gemmatimonadetes bacterium]|nr:hypothetical protein [Gemmatimonadota bacterium]
MWRCTPLPTDRVSQRHGTAIVAALAIVALAGALLATMAVHATAGASAAHAERAALVVEGAVRHALAEALVAWPPGADSIPEGGFADGPLMWPPHGAAGLSLQGRLRIHRLGTALYAVTVEAGVASTDVTAPIVRRRMRLLVRRPAPRDTGTRLEPVVPIARWGLAALY